MNEHQQTRQPGDQVKRGAALKEQRLQELLDGCQNEVLRQIIGPFGLTPAMFNDKDGGAVTTQQNAEKGVFAKESEEFMRTDYDYAAAKKEKMREAVRDGSMNSQEFVDQYSGKSEPTKRENSNGKLVMNAELDHLVPVKDIHGQGGWMKDQDGRKDLSSVKENLHYTTHNTNRSKSDKAPEVALSAEKGHDEERIQPLIDKAKDALEKELPDTADRLKYHGKELAREGATAAGKNALRQALGIILHEFISGSFSEIKALLKKRGDGNNLIDKLIVSLKRVMNRVLNKWKKAGQAFVEGGLQGLLSSLLTFLINNLITTSAKIVTLIREGMQSLWRAVNMMIKPPADMSALEITREVSKIIAALVTTGLGLMMEESVKGFIMTIAVLLPLADILAAALTAIMAGIAGALIVYGIDRVFDWLGETGTEILDAQENHMQQQAMVVGKLEIWLNQQFENSRLYALCAADYQRVQESYGNSAFQLEAASVNATTSVEQRDAIIDSFQTQIERHTQVEAALKLL